ncbi:SDR family oxidoreductase [Acidisphaera sp. L21]|uniref:SDR family oxidoreductase n=1 Tax=Acidisphaera sp. L21 TaxID=1641851 RepID=UPI0015777457|nr:SDR family oxidoreductase [Acidisphaera sp. L21]
MAGTVLVAGALGIIGRATMAQAIAAGKDAIGLSRRAPLPGTPGRFVSVDLTEAADCRAKLADLTGISHIVYAALFEKPDLGAGWLEADQIATNLAMLRNLLDAVEPANPDLKHITVLQGAKAYGVHLGQIPIPARENAPRHIHPNFYWAQEDLIRERQARAGWAWTIFRPQVVLGFAPGSAMNMLAAIGAYAAISRALGLPLVYPGIGHRITEATDVRLLARAIAWAAEAPGAANETFNITNGDVFVWQNIWLVVARCFDMDVGLPHPMPLAMIMPGKAEVWDALVRNHGLVANTLDGLVGSSWQFADFAFSRTHSTASLLSTIKIRQAGFADCIDTEESLGWELAELQRQRVLPP